MSTISMAKILPHSHRYPYALILGALPLVYIGFSLYSDTFSITLLEIQWGLPFFAVAGLGVFLKNWKWRYIVGIFWILHGIYDSFHQHLFINHGVPHWYPLLCSIIDFCVGIYLLL